MDHSQVFGFNPRSREGAIIVYVCGHGDIVVSIRAPVRERFYRRAARNHESGVSIRAPVRERYTGRTATI